MKMNTSTHYLFDDMIATQRDAMLRAFTHKGIEMSREQFAREYRVVSCGLGRMMGHSSYIRRKAKPGDVVITHCAASKALFDESFRFMRDGGVKVMTSPEQMAAIRGIPRDASPVHDVWIDTPIHSMKNWGGLELADLVSRMQQNSLFIVMGTPALFR